MQLSCTAWATSPTAACSKGRGQFSCSQVLRSSSSAPTPPGPPLPIVVGSIWVRKVSALLLSCPQGQLTCEPKNMIRSSLPSRWGCRVCSPVCCSWWWIGLVLLISWPLEPVLSPPTYSKGQRWRTTFSHPCHLMAEEGGRVRCTLMKLR